MIGLSYCATRVSALVFKIPTLMPVKKCSRCKQHRCTCCGKQDFETHSLTDWVSSAADTMLLSEFYKANPERYQEILTEARTWKASKQSVSASNNKFLVNAGLTKKT